MRHIAWFNESPIEPCAQGSLTSKDVFVRQRCLVPACEIEKIGVDCSVFGGLRKANPVDVGAHLQKLSVDVVVIGRLTCRNLLRLARAAKHLGCYVVADFAHDASLVPDCAKLVEIADQIVAATPETAARLLELTGRQILVIPDCDEKPGSSNSPNASALRWLDAFRRLEAKPPLCANSNIR